MTHKRQITCPACGAEGTLGPVSCARCGSDLSLLCTLAGVADAWFDRALKAAAADDPGPALEWISAYCAADPADAQARLVRAQLWAQLGHYAEARRCLEEARALGGNEEALSTLSEAIRKLEAATAAHATAAPERPRREKRQNGAAPSPRRKRSTG